MRIVLLIIVTCCGCFNMQSQITKTINFKNETTEIANYDSTENYVNNPYVYIGQTLYLNELTSGLRLFGYRNFYIDYQKPIYIESNIYKNKGGSSFSSNYDDLAAKYFNVVGVLSHENYKFLKIVDHKSLDTVYYLFEDNSYLSFPFITLGYYEKVKDMYLGNIFVSRGRNWIGRPGGLKSVNTGNIISDYIGMEWKCVDITIEDQNYELSLLLENNNSEQVSFSINMLNKGNYFLFKKYDSDNYKKKFGDNNWNLILGGIFKIGFTEEMVELAIGKPKDINYSSYGPDQWVYDSRFLYFENGKLVGYN